MKKFKLFITTIMIALLQSTTASAASITYTLTEAANTQWVDGVNYATVFVNEISDGDLYFRVSATSPFTLSKFGFNLNLASSDVVTIDMIPSVGTGWTQTNGSGYGNFGTADYEVVGNGNNPASIFEFKVSARGASITTGQGRNRTTVPGPNIDLFITMFIPNQQGNFIMANVVCPDGQGTVNGGQCGNLGANGRNANTDVTVGEVAAVPVPAAAWLFGSALLGFAGLRRKA